MVGGALPEVAHDTVTVPLPSLRGAFDEAGGKAMGNL